MSDGSIKESGSAALQAIKAKKGAIFDLDGVIVDTAKYHYLAWKRLASELGFDFSESHNEALKGVSRMRSLEILLEVGGIKADEKTRRELAEKKNNWYVDLISRMEANEVLPGARGFLAFVRSLGIKTALGSASRNAPLILDRLELSDFFDVIVDGNSVSKAKPDPEVFLKCAQGLGLEPSDCIVFEDAVAGIEAAKNAGMAVIGIGDPNTLGDADYVVPGLYALLPKD
jgi:beta-phosphoglucomutase